MPRGSDAMLCLGVGHLPNGFRPSLALYGSVLFFEDGVLHGFPARIFCFFMPWVGLGWPGSDLGTWSQHFGPGTFWSSKMSPEKHTFAMESFCEGEVGESLLPKLILWSLGPIWVGYFAPIPLYNTKCKQFQKFGNLVQAPGPSPGPSLFPLVGSGCIPLFGLARWLHTIDFDKQCNKLECPMRGQRGFWIMSSQDLHSGDNAGHLSLIHISEPTRPY